MSHAPQRTLAEIEKQIEEKNREIARLHNIILDELFWKPVGEAPDGKWLITRKHGEKGYTVSFRRSHPIHLPEGEWIDGDGYSTIANSGSFAPPTHFLPLPEGFVILHRREISAKPVKVENDPS